MVASHSQLPFALLVPFLCLSLCLVSPTDGLPWMVHLLYLSCQGLAVPYQLIPKESSKDEALKAIAEWKVPVYGCQRTLAAEIYQFNVQLLWCGNQYLDVVSVVLAIHMGYPFAAPMAMLFFISLAMQVVPSSNWDQLLLGRSPIALPAESNKVVLNRCLLENLPQLVIQVSLMIWTKSMAPFISAAVSALLILQQLCSYQPFWKEHPLGYTELQPVADVEDLGKWEPEDGAELKDEKVADRDEQLEDQLVDDKAEHVPSSSAQRENREQSFRKIGKSEQKSNRNAGCSCGLCILL